MTSYLPCTFSATLQVQTRVIYFTIYKKWRKITYCKNFLIVRNMEHRMKKGLRKNDLNKNYMNVNFNFNCEGSGSPALTCQNAEVFFKLGLIATMHVHCSVSKKSSCID